MRVKRSDVTVIEVNSISCSISEVYQTRLIVNCDNRNVILYLSILSRLLISGRVKVSFDILNLTRNFGILNTIRMYVPYMYNIRIVSQLLFVTFCYIEGEFCMTGKCENERRAIVFLMVGYEYVNILCIVRYRLYLVRYYVVVFNY